MSYAVYHSEKGKVSSAVIGKHIDREVGSEYTFKHADPEKKHLNQSFNLNELCKIPVHQAVEKRISQGYKTKDKSGELKTIRKDAVKYNTHILTGSHEKMKEIESNPQKMNRWINENKTFLEQEFGKDNIVRFVLHRDEKTPHLHAITVNLTQDGRLSAKDIIGNKKEMQLRQDRYAEAMAPFGLERGVRSTGISHEGAREYYARMQDALDSINKPDLEVKKTVLGAEFGIDKEKTIELLRDQNRAQKTALNSKLLDIEKSKKREKEAAEYKNKVLQANKNLSDAIKRILVDENFRGKIFNEKVKEQGDKYGYDLKQKFHFVSHDIQSKSDSEITQMVSNAIKNLVKEKNISNNDLQLFINSKEVENVFLHLVKERERLNELDQHRGRGKGRGI